MKGKVSQGGRVHAIKLVQDSEYDYSYVIIYIIIIISQGERVQAIEPGEKRNRFWSLSHPKNDEMLDDLN